MKAIERFKKFLSAQYSSFLGRQFCEDVSLSNDTDLSWIDQGSSAWLLDGEIGLALNIVPYTSTDDDLNSTIQNALRIANQLQPRFGVSRDELLTSIDRS